MLKTIKIFSDGSCLGNPGPGGYSFIIQHLEYENISSSGFYLTTNNRMELMGIIVATESLKQPCCITISTDSQYVQKGILYWIKNWKTKGWKTSRKTYVKNVDLWLRLEKSLNLHQVTWKWIKSHSGNKKNEQCDHLARESAKFPTLKDFGYIL
ncbi:ribonuclease HI [Buchnera aphidicola str. Bp (Baizongia pistaciae)]|uniref:Ribonuclease H n=1 Tax=Buchnera aphidicola subsp. Baizongia pistaciae (strain Bp) TaxID=224915 RepID=RNH_BUCBP|nr:ribonuclease HI [Buchnera aphidicola]P59434.1 RecName: Full=Ribonuclease H; Short=RNase H [Buchnera aphidicola str. Bp (Baizongia pistaciae)]AAO26957.1 ribonuclease HI [Buchnera aphidicola str. Bp (Baizongia pistaciae)]